MSDCDSMDATKAWLLMELRDRGVSWSQVQPWVFLELVQLLFDNRNLQYQTGVVDTIALLVRSGSI